MSNAVNPHILELSPYQPGKDIDETARKYGLKRVIKLASNENPLGPSPKVAEALLQIDINLALYPDPDAYALKAAIAQKYGIKPEQLTLAGGSDALFDYLLKVYVSPNETVLFSEYGFAAYPIACKTLGIPFEAAPAKDYAHDLDAMRAAISDKTKLIFIANPNNPTGTLFTHDDFAEFMASVPERVIVVLDEAYLEYAASFDAPRSLELLVKHPNLVVTRTFSKAFGLAGLRLGYAVSSEARADYLNRVRLPFNITSISQRLALVALEDDDHINRSVETNLKGLKQWKTALDELELPYLPTFGNFITVDCRREAQPIFEALLQRGIILRPLGPYRMPHHLRITIGTEEENQIALAAFKQIIEEN